jgi:hypothetical protein
VQGVRMIDGQGVEQFGLEGALHEGWKRARRPIGPEVRNESCPGA